jgi:hypothetical protein
MPSVSVPVAIAGAGALGAAGSVASSVIGANAAESAAKTQANAADQAAQMQLAEFNQTQSNLAPFVAGGKSAFSNLLGLTGNGPGGQGVGPLTQPFNPTMAQLAQTPGYQFTLGQGELGVQNSFAAQGLGSSGAALKGGVNYAEGLASTTYQQQFQNYLQQNQQIYSMLGGLSNIGSNAAAMTGTQGLTATGNAGQFLTAGAAAGAAGQIGAANAIGGGISGITGAGSNTALLLALNQGGMFGNPGSTIGIPNSDIQGGAALLGGA